VQGTTRPAKDPAVHDTLGFVHRFSRINISCNQILQQWGKSADKQKTLPTIQGNSRDDVTGFKYACKNYVYGCAFAHGFRVEVSRHEEICPIMSRAIFDSLAQKEAAKIFQCAREGCSRSFETVGKRNRHVKDMHIWPQPCPKGCESTFNNRTDYNKHMDTHSDYKPSKCLVPDCESVTIFQSSKQYRKHVKNVHKLHRHEIDQFMPYKKKKKKKFVPTLCQVEDCSSTATWIAPNRYKAHLRVYHVMDEDGIQFYLAAAGC
jgi:hypothetical protein